MADSGGSLPGSDLHDRVFGMRLDRSRADLFGMLERLYGARPDYPEFCTALTAALEAAWAARPEDLKWQDLRRDLEPDWFLRPGMVGYVFYLDRFNGDLAGVLDRLDWLERLGVTYVHFMPCLKPRPGDSDGGYSVMDYRGDQPRPSAPWTTSRRWRRRCAGAASASASTSCSTTPPRSTTGPRRPAPGRRRHQRLLPDVRRRRGCRSSTRRPSSRSSPTTRRAASPSTRTSANGSGPPSTSTSGT